MTARTTSMQDGAVAPAEPIRRIGVEGVTGSADRRLIAGHASWLTVSWATLLALPLLAFLVIFYSPLDGPRGNALNHLLIVVTAAGIAAFIAGGVLVAAGGLRDSRVLFLVLGYLSIATVFACHGLATPNMLHDGFNPAVGNSAFLSMISGSLFIALSVAPLSDRIRGWISRRYMAIGGVVVAALAVYAFSVVIDPTSFVASLPGDWISAYEGVVGKLVNLAALTFLAFAAWRYYQAYELARLPSQFVAFVAVVLLAEAQIPMAFGTTMWASWWIYHVLIFASCGLIVTSWLWELGRSGAVSVITESLLIHEGLKRVSRGYPEAITALNSSLEAHDAHTLGHTTRVAGVALEMAATLKLSPGKQRVCTLVAQLHDIGKLGTPQYILNKPAKLTDEEFEEIKVHTSRGSEILSRFDELASISAAVRAHHERFDGKGYPDGLEGKMIPIEARVVSVADVYDALTSDRPYRSAWTSEQALSYIREEAGKQFDPAMVAALERVISAEGAIGHESAA